MSATDSLFDARPMACPKLRRAYEEMVAADLDSFLRRLVLDWRATVEEVLAEVRRG